MLKDEFVRTDRSYVTVGWLGRVLALLARIVCALGLMTLLFWLGRVAVAQYRWAAVWQRGERIAQQQKRNPARATVGALFGEGMDRVCLSVRPDGVERRHEMAIEKSGVTVYTLRNGVVADMYSFEPESGCYDRDAPVLFLLADGNRMRLLFGR